MDVTKQKALLENLAHEYFRHIADHYGVSKYYQGFPCLSIVDDNEELLSGEFRDDCCEVMVNLGNFYHLDEISAKTELIRTLTHEYIHYLQCPWWKTRYDKMYEYWDHPYEREAYQREDELLTDLLNLEL